MAFLNHLPNFVQIYFLNVLLVYFTYELDKEQNRIVKNMKNTKDLSSKIYLVLLIDLSSVFSSSSSIFRFRVRCMFYFVLIAFERYS